MSVIKSRRVWTLALAGVVVAGAPVLVRSLYGQMTIGGAVSAVEGANLGNEMKAMGTEYKAIKGQITDKTKNTATLTSLAEFEGHVLSAKLATPPGASTQPADKKEAYVTGYREDLITLETQALGAEKALLDSDNDKAATLVADMGKTEAMGHADYRPKGN